MSEVTVSTKKPLLHRIFGSTPGDGEMQPKEALSYSWCGFGQNLVCTVVGSYLTVFMTDALGFEALWVALLMLGARIFDACNDPIMGSIVDRTRTKWGKCRPYLKWMALPIAILTAICFLPWYPATAGGFVAIAVMYIVWGIIYTIADVPYWGLSTAMTNDTFKRGNMLTVARLFCTVGAGLVTIIIPFVTSNITATETSQVTAIQNLINYLGEGHADIGAYASSVFANIPNLSEIAPSAQLTELFSALSAQGIDYNVSGAALLQTQAAIQSDIQGTLRWVYFISAIVCVVIAIPLFFLGFKNTRERNQTLGEPPTLTHNLKLLFKNKPLLMIVLSGIGGAGRMLFTYTGGLYFAKYVLADVVLIPGFMEGEALYTLFTVAVVPGGLIASLLVPYFTKKVGKRNTYIYSHLVGGVFMMIAFIVGITTDKGNYTSVATLVMLIIALVVAGVPQGFGNIITYAMIGDTVEYLELKTGERAEGICFAMQTFINKIGMAIGAFVGVMAYLRIYESGALNNPARVIAADKDVMWIVLMLVAALSFFLTAIPLFFYKFNEKEQQEAVVEMNKRNLAAAGEAEVDIDGDTVVSTVNAHSIENESLIERISESIIFPNESLDINDDEDDK